MSWLKDFGLLRSLGWGARSKVVFGNPMTVYSTAYSRVDFLAYEALQTHARPQRKACLVFRSLVRLRSTPYRRI